jgi:hypothetical protein
MRMMLGVAILQLAACAGAPDRASVERDDAAAAFVATDASSATAEPSFLQRLTRL